MLVKYKQGYINLNNVRFILDKHSFSVDGMSIKRADEDIPLEKFVNVTTHKSRELYLPINRVGAFNLKSGSLIDITENDRSNYKLLSQVALLEKLAVIKASDWYIVKQAIDTISLFVEELRNSTSYEYEFKLVGGQSVSVSLDKEMKL